MTTSGVVELRLRGPEATLALGRRLAAGFPGGGAPLALSGELGAGKTTLVKGLAEGLGVASAADVTSPTFLRVVRFEAAPSGGPALVHVDAYRLRGPEEWTDLGLEEDLCGDACVVVEWPEMVAGALPADRLVVALDHVDGESRTARLHAGGARSARWLAAIDLETEVTPG